MMKPRTRKIGFSSSRRAGFLRSKTADRVAGFATAQVVGQASRLPHRASRPRCLLRGRDARLTGGTPAPLPEQLPGFAPGFFEGKPRSERKPNLNKPQ